MKRKWWHDKTAYQIYPKSFLDTNGDGIGDLRGIIEKLPYLEDLGIDLLWLSPVYCSPMADEGYDISDYYSIDPRFGTMEDMDELIAEAKKRGIAVLMDLVVNHCSDEHEWFKRACADPEGRYGKYFYIRDGRADGTAPTNWRTYFGGPAWDPLPGHPGKYYLHVFHKKQPDLNWENPELREEIYRNINWWMEKGLGGFRIDAICNIKKPAAFHDYEPDREDGTASVRHILEEAEGIDVFLNELKRRCFEPYDAFTVGEVFNERAEEIPMFIGQDGFFCSIFDFTANHYGRSDLGWYAWKPCLPGNYRDCTFAAQKAAGTECFLSNIIENHDEPRGASRYIPDGERDDTSKKALAAASFLLHGIPFLYQGQEIGMENKRVGSYEEISDVSTKGEYQAAVEAGCSKEEALRAVSAFSRDNARTPMQWDGSPHAGFTSGTPWLMENENYKRINVEANLQDPESVLHFYRKLIRLKKDPALKDTLVYGETVPYLPSEENLMAYFRKSVPAGWLDDLHEDTPEILAAVNMCGKKRRIPLPEKMRKILLSNLPVQEIRDGALVLLPWQAVVLTKEDA